MSEKNNPLQDPLVLIVVGVVFLGAIGKCSREASVAAPPMAPTLPTWQMIVTGLTQFVIPFIVVSFIVFIVTSLVCRYAKMGEIHSVDFRQVALCLSGLCAIAIIYPGIPNAYEKWRYGVWAALLFGGPLSFWFLASNHTQCEDEGFRKEIESPLTETIEKLREELSNAESKADSLAYGLTRAKEKITALESSAKAREDRVAEDRKRKGILDSDDF